MNLALRESGLPVRLRFAQPITDEELLRFCAENEPWRVEQDANGELIVMSPTGSEGGGFETDVATELNVWARIDGRGKVFGSNAGWRLPDGSVRAADCHWVSLRRWNALSREEQKTFAPVCPEFVIEVRSETDRLPELEEKMRLWLANGAELAWMVDPVERVVRVYRPGAADTEVLVDPSSVQGSGPVTGFELVMQRVWG